MTAQVSAVVNASPTTVWEALTDPDAIRTYFLGATVDTDWQVGSPITWSGEWQGRPYQDRGEILAVEANRELKYSHWSPLTGSADEPDNYHVIDVTLNEVDGGTEVTLTQSNLNGTTTDADREHRADYEQTWKTMLDGLKKTVET
jgi:uncharacterized protein YndB with AHSA1/START domain